MAKLYGIIGWIFLLTSLGAQEYWKDFFLFNDPIGFDNPPYQSMELTRDQALSLGSYTEVIHRDGNIQEALSYVTNQPEYYYQFYYDEGRPVLRRSYYVDDFLELVPLSELFYYYDQEGLWAVSLYEYSLFDADVKSRQFTKLREDNLLRYKERFQLDLEQDILNRLETQEAEIMGELNQLDSILMNNLSE